MKDWTRTAQEVCELGVKGQPQCVGFYIERQQTDTSDDCDLSSRGDSVIQPHETLKRFYDS